MTRRILHTVTRNWAGDPLVFDFFAAFARMEYALKTTHKYARRSGDGYAAPAWTRFADQVERAFEARTDVHASADRLLALKVERQMYERDRIRWESVAANESRTRNIVTAIQGVRNNLFHGGKDRTLGTRDRELLSLGLELLEVLVTLDEDVRHAAEEPPIRGT